MDKCLDKILFIKIQSDISISGRNYVEHLRVLEISIVNTNIRQLKNDIKRVFLQPEVTSLGFRTNKDGLLPLPEKVEIIKNAQVPKNVNE